MGPQSDDRISKAANPFTAALFEYLSAKMLRPLFNLFSEMFQKIIHLFAFMLQDLISDVSSPVVCVIKLMIRQAADLFGLFPGNVSVVGKKQMPIRHSNVSLFL